MSDLIRREDALRVTLAYASSYSAEQAETAINALRAVQLAHVNERPKSEHDTANVLTPDNADHDDPDDPHILQAIIDSLLTNIADLTRQLQGQPRRPQDVTKGGA